MRGCVPDSGLAQNHRGGGGLKGEKGDYRKKSKKKSPTRVEVGGDVSREEKPVGIRKIIFKPSSGGERGEKSTRVVSPPPLTLFSRPLL